MFCVFVLSFGISEAYAQQKTITGTVTSVDGGITLPGVTVVVKGTMVGTITDINGIYKINIPENRDIVIFSFVGMKTIEKQIGNVNIVNVVMEPDVIGVDEVVVTALGIKKSKKALGYAVSEIKADDLDKVQVIDATKALQGRVAGVDVSSSSGAPGSSTRVIVRGVSSITQSNQPLYVVDGIPINNEFNSGNSTSGVKSVTRSMDFGNGASDINPSDIESINILKGAAATSLYGSRAANGAIIITTKSGAKNQDLKINFSSSSSFSNVGRLPYYQRKFGQGWSGLFAYEENGSWGPLLDGRNRLIGNEVDNMQRVMPFEYQDNSLRDFYEYGYSLNNSISLSGGGDKIGYFASYTNVKQDGIVPGPVDILDRNTLTFKANGGTDKTKISFSTSYVNKKVSAVATGQSDDAGAGKVLFQELLQNPVNHYIPLYRDYKGIFDNIDNYYTPYAQNPYFIVNENGNNFVQDRIISSVNIEQKIIDKLKISWRGGVDHYSNFYKDYGAMTRLTKGSPNYALATPVAGATTEEARMVTQLNSDIFLNYDGVLDVGNNSLEYGIILGNNINQRYSKRTTTIAKGLVVPEYYNVTNIKGSADVSTYEYLRRSVGLFATVSLNFNNYLFTQITARNDWSSTLPKNNNSFFYPGINLGFIFSEFIPKNRVLTYGKLRGGYAFAGNDGPVYALDSYYSSAVIRNGGYGETRYPVGGVPAFEKSQLLGNPNLSNELSKEFEIGTDMRFLNNKIGLDIAYYNKKTTDLIFTTNIAASTGFRQQVANLGQITNSGIEFKLDLTPVKTSSFRWDLTYMYTKNNTILDKLSEEYGVSEYIINGIFETEFVAIPGKQLGQFRIPDYKYTPNGKIIVGDNGLPLEGDKVLIASSIPDYKMSLINTLTFKGVRLSALVDYQNGGYMYSYTADMVYWTGNTEQSLINDRRPWVIPNTVKEVIGKNGDITYVENSTPVYNNWEDYYSSNTNKPIEEKRIIDKTYLKLRELSLNYTLPDKIVKKIKLTSLNIGVFGSNLFLWTPVSNSFIDPETTTYGNGIEGLFGEFGGAPSVRSYGVKLNLIF